MTWQQFLFGSVSFSDSEEYLEFRFRFLIVVLLTGSLFTAVFIVGDQSGLNPLDSPHLRSMTVFALFAFTLWLMLRGHKERFHHIAWGYLAGCLLEYLSALLLVPDDELRILWFYVNVPGVYILLGQRAGLAVTALTLVLLAGLNPWLSRPYSRNAMATALVALMYLGLFFHVHANRSISYFVRMRQSAERLRELASHDPLTGVLNARAFYEAGDRLLGLARRTSSPCAVLFIDLDHFKSINDTHGHAAGDQVLRAVAHCLQSRLRRSDLLGRIGGEEFSVLLPETGLETALGLAEQWRQAIERLHPELPDHGPLQITASIGVASHRHGSVDRQLSLQALQSRADQAMYRAKATGRNRVSSLDTPEPAAA